MQLTDDVQRSGALTRLRNILLTMTNSVKRLPNTAAMILGVVRAIAVPEVGIMEAAMAKEIKFYIPKDFRKSMKRVRELPRGRILEFRT